MDESRVNCENDDVEVMVQEVNTHDEVLHHLPHSQVSAGISLRSGVYISHLLDIDKTIQLDFGSLLHICVLLHPFGGLRSIQGRRSKGCVRLFLFLHSLTF